MAEYLRTGVQFPPPPPNSKNRQSPKRGCRFFYAFRMSLNVIHAPQARKKPNARHPDTQAPLVWSGKSWRMDEAYIKIKDPWKYHYLAVDKNNETIDFLFTVHRFKKAALRFFKKGQIASGDSQALSATGQFYSLAV